MKSKVLPIFTIAVTLFVYSCKSDSLPPLDVRTINTVYWTIPHFPDTLSSDAVVLKGEVGNNNDVDSLHVTVTDVDLGTTLYSGTILKSQLTPEDRKDYPASTIKWYKINYKPSVALPSNSSIQFTLVAHTPFGTGQDLRPKSTNSVFVE